MCKSAFNENNTSAILINQKIGLITKIIKNQLNNGSTLHNMSWAQKVTGSKYYSENQNVIEI